MTRLAREFAVILIISLPEKTPLESVEKDLYNMESGLEMTFTIKPLEDHAEADTLDRQSTHAAPYMVTVSGHDQVGITYQVAQKLADLHVNITDLNAQVIDGEDGPVYIMMLEVMLPETLREPDLTQALKPIAEALGVEISCRPIEAVAF